MAKAISYCYIMTVDNNERFLKTQMILVVIPTVITQLFAFYRIRKLVYGIIIEVIISSIDLIILSFWWPFGMMITLPISVLIPLYYIRKWTLEFNKTKSMF
jgi:type III secretory pathway component EscR